MWYRKVGHEMFEIFLKSRVKNRTAISRRTDLERGCILPDNAVLLIEGHRI